MTAQEIGFLIATVAGSSVLTAIVTVIAMRKKTLAETEQLKFAVTKDVIQMQSDQYKRDQKQIDELRAREELQEKQHNECEQRGKALQIRLDLMQKRLEKAGLDLSESKLFTVFVLDDDELVRDAFKKKLSVLPNVDVRVFANLPEIIADINDMPEFLVLDYRIEGLTIDNFMHQIIKMYDYNPKIIIITGMPKEFRLPVPFPDFIMAHYNKDEDFVNKTVNDIMEYISNHINNN